MAPNKFEDHIRTQLSQRQIEPSKAGWEKLNARLEIQETKSNSKWWLGIAAAVVFGLIAITGINFFGGNFEGPQVAEEPKNKEVDIEKPVDIVKENSQTKIAEAEYTEKKTKKLDAVVVSNNIIEGTAAVINKPEERSQQPIAANNVAKSKSEVAESPVPLIHNSIIEHEISPKLNDVVVNVEVEVLQEQSINNEVDALLREAASNTPANNVKHSYNASAITLLQDVETELEPTFRNKVFEMIKDGYVKAKTAVVTRNN